MIGTFSPAKGTHAQERYRHEGLRVKILNNLSFGTMVIGRDFEKRVSFADASAGKAWVSGFDGDEMVTLNFFLPRYLSSDGHELEIDFDQNSAAWSTANDPGSATSFDPNSRLRLYGSKLASGKLYLWIGGTILLNSHQAAGQYQGNIQVQIDVDHNED